MLKTRKNSFKKNMAILVCLAFISVSFPGVTHATTKSSPIELPFLKKYLSSLSPFFYLLNLNSPSVVYDLAIGYNLSTKDKPPSDKSKDDKKDNNNKDPYDDHGNSTGKKPANGKD